MKNAKHYPMNGPSLEIQKLMMSPRANAKQLTEYFNNRPQMRKETAAIANLK